MKILVLSNFYPPEVVGGYELACAQAVEALRRRGHEVLVLTAAARAYCDPEPHVRRSFSITDIWNLDAMSRRLDQRSGDRRHRAYGTRNIVHGNALGHFWCIKSHEVLTADEKSGLAECIV